MNPFILIAIFSSFFITYLIIPHWIKKAKMEGLVGKDIHKKNKPEVAEGGGISIILGTSIGILLYIALSTFYIGTNSKLIYIFVALCVMLIGSIVGIVDDLLGWKKGLSWKTKIALVLFSAIPLMVINAGDSAMNFPFLGVVNFGLFYPLLIVPLGVIGATTTFNILAGYNGLEAGQGILILGSLAIVTYITGNGWLSVVALCMVASLIAFYIFNKYPAKIFPGDITTYSVGAMIATIAILGNVEKIALIFFIPYILEAGLKLRGKIKKESFAKVNGDGNLEMPYDEIYGLEHLAIFLLKKVKSNRKVSEREVVCLIHGFQIIMIVIGFLTLI